MTHRETVVQAHIELGPSREAAELRAKISDAVLPETAAMTQCLVSVMNPPPVPSAASVASCSHPIRVSQFHGTILDTNTKLAL